MDFEIIWLPKAERRFAEIIEYLQYKWNDKVITDFIKKTERVLQQVKRNPRLFRHSGQMNIHQVLITKHNMLLYRINGNLIELLTFFDTRQNPKKKFKF